MSQIREAKFEDVFFGEVKTCWYTDYKQSLLVVKIGYNEVEKQWFHVEILRVDEFLAFIGIDHWNKIPNSDIIRLVEKGRNRIKSIVKLSDNKLGYERFLLNKVFDNGLPADYPFKKD